MAFPWPSVSCPICPFFKEAVLLDIDVDYFDPPDLGKKYDIPSIWPDELIAFLMKKGMKADVATVSYSVKGGCRRIEYKFLGDDLASLLKDPKEGHPGLSKIREHRKSGHVFRSKRLYAEAEKEFQKALELSPNDAALHYGLGLVYDQWGKPEGASVEFDQAKAIDGVYGDQLLMMPRLLFPKGNVRSGPPPV